MEPAAKRAKSEAGGAADAPAPAAQTTVRASHAATKGRKKDQEDVAVLVDTLDPNDSAARRRSFYAVLDGHGGRDCADWVAHRLPELISERVRGASHSSAVKEALRSAFVACDAELLRLCESNGWCDGCCAIGVLVDQQCTPARGYVCNLGDSRAYARVQEEGSDARPAVALSKDHFPVDPKERKRIEQAGGHVSNGRVCGSLEVSRSFGDLRLKRLGLSASPDVTSFAIGAAQRFLLLGCDGVWRVFSGEQACSLTAARLATMDARRDELSRQLADSASASALTKEVLGRLSKEREGACEEAVLRGLLHEAVHARNAKDNLTLLLVRLDAK
jgi:serine/threonine protein phosphatase PrpC